MQIQNDYEIAAREEGGERVALIHPARGCLMNDSSGLADLVYSYHAKLLS